jgi:hypothetical protein
MEDVIMDYAKIEPPKDEIPCVEEPAAVYGVSESAAKEPWEDLEDGYGDSSGHPNVPAGVDWLEWCLEPDPEFQEFLEREVTRITADVEAGRFIPNEVVQRHTQRFLETGIFDKDYGEEYKWLFTE